MDEVFTEGEPRVRPRVSDLLDRVSDLLSTRGPEVREVTFGLPRGPGGDVDRQSLLRAGVLARTAVAFGMPERILATGLGDHRDPELVIEFRAGSPPQIDPQGGGAAQ
jgi:hypothetical protein